MGTKLKIAPVTLEPSDILHHWLNWSSVTPGKKLQKNPAGALNIQ